MPMQILNNGAFELFRSSYGLILLSTRHVHNPNLKLTA